MIKRIWKKSLQKNSYIISVITKLLYLYLRFVYFTSSWQLIFSDNNKEEFLAQRGVIFVLWHNRLIFGPRIFQGHKDVYALISPHSDGQIINNIVNKFGFGIIDGSTNKNSVGALKIIIKKLSDGSNIVITPDGPRGPIYQINSSITKIAKKYNIKLIPISCHASKYFLLKSWDKLIMPWPFSKIVILIDSPLILVENEQENNNNLEQKLMRLTNMSFIVEN